MLCAAVVISALWFKYGIWSVGKNVSMDKQLALPRRNEQISKKWMIEWYVLIFNSKQDWSLQLIHLECKMMKK